ncbi:polyprenyl synthetase family protein [Alkalihalobacillus sp. MEB130]|uniref:polyprenyl synthetase family protein n=1 Tax=Alkalihalobacillus sp. MEB130 TaxID=2976704 RepID=UPI0028DE3493|nr:farnesyl diphosphate synthase [Alkalihalobacillus sp. MEB130]MDT8862533.1 polyprenyl synthetase family protein [Alkalihalobacillus sp. MEB130]
MNHELTSFLKEIKGQVEARLPQHIERLSVPERLAEAMIYSLEAGGKRIRPALLLATIQCFDKRIESGLDVACAMEMIHTYSLIHDDLPAMDDDDMRRGKPTNHKVFGEALAILAGDALLTYSFELVAKMEQAEVSAEQKLLLIQEIAKAAGPEGMVGGQVADIEGENKSLSLEELVYIHHHKTGDLLTASIVSGAIIAGASEGDIGNLRMFAKELGLMFQIKDDILDVEGDQETIGKPIGSDDGNNKSTYPNLLGLDGAKMKLNEHMLQAKEYLYRVDMNHELLLTLTNYVAERDH